jgi:transposase
MRSIRTAEHKEESMKDITQTPILGIDVSRDHLDGYFLPDGKRFRLPNTEAGHARLIELLALRPDVVVCFEATGGQEWRLWAALDTVGIAPRQLPPAQIKAFAASRGTRAKTDRIDAELIARFLDFRPDAGRLLPHKKLRFLRAWCAKRGQLVEMRKRLLAQTKARMKNGSGGPFESMDGELKALLGIQIADLQTQIEAAIAADPSMGNTACILRSIIGVGPVTSWMLIAELPELGQISGEQAAALTGLAPIAHDSGAMRGKRAIGGGRRNLRHVLFQAALVASHHNPRLTAFADRLRKRGKPHKVVIIAVARKLIIIANALCKSRQIWAD